MATPALAYDEADKEVVDVEEPPFRPVAGPPIARSRTSTGELTMQVLVDGEWHRRMPEITPTSCEREYNTQFSPVRREELTHPLCPVCFTPAEIARADRAFVKKYDLEWFRRQFGRDPAP